MLDQMRKIKHTHTKLMQHKSPMSLACRQLSLSLSLSPSLSIHALARLGLQLLLHLHESVDSVVLEELLALLLVKRQQRQTRDTTVTPGLLEVVLGARDTGEADAQSASDARPCSWRASSRRAGSDAAESLT